MIVAGLLAQAAGLSGQTIISTQFAAFGDKKLDPATPAGAMPAANFNLGASDQGNDADSRTGRTLMGSNLVDATGKPTKTSFALSYEGTFTTEFRRQGIPANNRLLGSVFFIRRANDQPSTKGVTLTINGLDPAGRYNLYIYYASPPFATGSAGVIALGEQSISINTNNAAAARILTQASAKSPLGNYVVFGNLTGAATAVVTLVNTELPDGESVIGLTAFQLVEAPKS